MDANSNTRAVRNVSIKIDIPGYIVDATILRNINSIAEETLLRSGKKTRASHTFSAKFGGQEVQNFKNFEQICNALDASRDDIDEIKLRYSLPEQSALDITFAKNGKISIGGFSSEIDFNFNISRLQSEIRRCEQEYSILVRKLFFTSRARTFPIIFMFFCSAFLMYSLLTYLYALRVGVNIDPTLITPGMTYFQKVESAIRSDDVNRKLNVLLSGQLRGFTNLSDYLIRKQRDIIISLVAIVFMGAAIYARVAIAPLYPRAIFLFGDAKIRLSKIQHKRDVWTIAIGIGFIINLIAGFVVAILSAF